MRIVITGANGMLGRSLQRALVNHEVIQHTRCVSDLSKFGEANIFNDFISRAKPDYVIHTAARVGGLNDNKTYPYEYIHDNNVINSVVLHSCVKNNVPRFLGILSVCCYGEGFPDEAYPLTEDMIFQREPHPTNAPYAYSKRNLAQSIIAYRKQFQKNYNYIIPANLYGEEDSRGIRAHFCSIMIDKVIEAVRSGGNKAEFVGNPDAKRQYVYVEDFAKIIKNHLEKDLQIDYNVASTEELSAREMVDTLISQAKLNISAEFGNSMVQGQLKRTVSTDLFYQQHPNFAFTPFAEGVERVYNSWAK